MKGEEGQNGLKPDFLQHTKGLSYAAIDGSPCYSGYGRERVKDGIALGDPSAAQRMEVGAGKTITAPWFPLTKQEGQAVSVWQRPDVVAYELRLQVLEYRHFGLPYWKWQVLRSLVSAQLPF